MATNTTRATALAAALAVPWTAAAASDDVTLGIKGGVNVTSVRISGPEAFDPDPVPKGALGGFFAYRLRDRLAIGAELLYSGLGITTDDFGVEARIDARGILLPVPLTLELGSADAPHAFVSGGPMWTFFGRTVETFDGVEQEIDEELDDVDFSWFVGGGIRFPLGRRSMSVEGRYAHGLVDIDATEEDTVKTRSFLVLVAFGF